MTDTDTMQDDTFFDYRCDRTGEPFCERVHIMNLALNYIDEEYCLPVLAAEHNKTEAEMAGFAWDYAKQRDCFKDPWLKFDASGCPKMKDNTCFCQKEQ